MKELLPVLSACFCLRIHRLPSLVEVFQNCQIFLNPFFPSTGPATSFLTYFFPSLLRLKFHQLKTHFFSVPFVLSSLQNRVIAVVTAIFQGWDPLSQAHQYPGHWKIAPPLDGIKLCYSWEERKP